MTMYIQIYVIRVLTNFKFGLFYSNFLILTPTFSKVPIEKNFKTPIFFDKQNFYSYFQNPSENSGYNEVCYKETALYLQKFLMNHNVFPEKCMFWCDFRYTSKLLLVHPHLLKKSPLARK